MIKTDDREAAVAAVGEAVHRLPASARRGVKLAVDVDPQ